MGDTAVLVSFGPIMDRILTITACLMFFVYGVATVQMIWREAMTWIDRKKGIKPLISTNDPSIVLYEVMWGITMTFDTHRTRVSSSVEDAIQELFRENGEGYIRYRVHSDIPGLWGTPALWDDYRFQEVFLEPLKLKTGEEFYGKHIQPPSSSYAVEWPKTSEEKEISVDSSK